MDQKPINRDFYQNSQEFVIAALGVLRAYFEKGERVRYVIVERSKIEGTSFGTTFESKPRFSELIVNHKKEIECLPEFDACVKAMRSDPKIAKHILCMIRTRHGGFSCPESGFLLPLLLDQLSERNKSLDFNKSDFDLAYGSLEQFFYVDMIPLQSLAPLDNFDSDTHEIDLGEGLRIRRMTSEELGQILDHVKQPYPIVRLKYAAELTHKTQKILGEGPRPRSSEPDMDEREEFDRLVTALRLFKTGTIGSNIILTKSLMRIPLIGNSASGNLDDYRVFSGRRYTLNRSEASEFRGFWNSFGKMDLSKPASLTVAIRRFSYAYERLKLEDRIIDFAVAFEALFSKEHEGSESIGYKLSLRAARLLAKDYLQRKHIMKDMRNFYGLRSKIVHGEAFEFGDDLAKTVAMVEDYLRKAIKLFIEQLQTSEKNEIISHLDLD